MATTWLNNGLPADVCAREPSLQNYGFYRKLNTGNYEFISFCDPKSQEWIAVYQDDFYKILNALLPAKSGSK